MFKKLVTNLPYSPGLLNQVGFYAKRLKQEEFSRRIGMIFAVLALLVNINLSVFSPEPSVLASPGNDVITGGIYGSTATQMQDKAIAAMRNSAYTRAIFDYYGITENDIRNTSINYLNTADASLRSVGRQSIGRGAESCKVNNGYSFCERSMYAAYSNRSLNVKVLSGVRYGKISKGDPWFSIAEACGNVIIRVGKEESISVNKVLSPQQGQTVKAGDIVDFRISVKSNNGNGAAFPVITDTLPEHTAYVDHSPKDMFTKADISGRTIKLHGDGLYGLGGNEERIITIRARILESAPAGARLCNDASATTLGANAITNNKPCVTVNTPQPEPMCVGLRMLGAGGTNTVRTFEAEAKPDGATISQYVFDFGDGKQTTLNSSASKVSTNHTYSPGKYTAKVLVKTSAGNVGNSGTCVVNITVDAPTPEPSVTCDYIKLLTGTGDELKRTFEASATPENGATVTSFVVDFGDNSKETVANNSTNKITASHTYSEAGKYTVRLTAKTSLGEITNNSSCKLVVDIEPKPEVCEYNPELPKDSEECVPPETCPTNEALPPDSPDCGTPHIFKLKKAENVTQGIKDAHGTTANAGDVIKYTLVTENDGTAVERDFEIKEDLADVLQYANLIDADGGKESKDGLRLTWPKVDIKPGQVIEKTITVKIKSPIPSTPVSASDSLAFDNKLENAWGNNVTIKVPKTPVKQVEGAVTSLPNTGPGMNALISTLFIGIVSYFYFRNRLISKELGMIKNEFSGGVL
jgi:uncharacterized repeat protein (TIGR01451 family)